MTRIIETNTTNLSNLPVEIILCIRDFLRPAGIASLALCDHRFLKILQICVPSPRDRDGNSSKDATFRLGDGYRTDFLRLMDTKLPHLHFCYDCRGLHPWKEIKVPGPIFEDSTTGPNESCIRYNPESTTLISQERGRPLNPLPFPFSTRYTFRFAHLQLVMRQFNHGPGFGFKPEDLRYTEVQLREIWGLDIRFLMSVEAKIAQIPGNQPSLCVRVQHLISAPRCWVWNSYMCSHIRLPGYSPPIYTGFAMCQAWTEVCVLCRTTYRFRSVDYIQNPKHLIELTKWIDMGTGSLLEGLDASTQPSQPKRPDMSYRLFEEPLANDSVPEISVAQLSYMNESLLEDKRYAEVMEKVRPGYWVLQGDEKHRFFSG